MLEIHFKILWGIFASLPCYLQKHQLNWSAFSFTTFGSLRVTAGGPGIAVGISQPYQQFFDLKSQFLI